MSVSLYTSRMDASGRSTNEDPRDARMNSDMPARTKSSLRIWETTHAKGMAHKGHGTQRAWHAKGMARITIMKMQPFDSAEEAKDAHYEHATVQLSRADKASDRQRAQGTTFGESR